MKYAPNMKSNSLGKKTTAATLTLLLSGCASSTEAHRAFSVVGPMIGGVGLALSQTDGHKEDPNKSVEGFWEIGPVYRHSLVSEVRNVPLEIRTLPHHFSLGTSRITDDEVTVGPRTGMFMRYGEKLRLVKDSLFLRAGVEMELSGMPAADNPDSGFTTVDPSYYSLYTKAGPNWNSFLIPKVFTGLETKISDTFTLGAGYKLWREDLVAERGYLTGSAYGDLSREKEFNLVDMTVGSVVGSLKYRPSGKGYLFLELGTQNILNKKDHPLGREADIDFAGNSFTVTFGGQLSF